MAQNSTTTSKCASSGAAPHPQHINNSNTIKDHSVLVATANQHHHHHGGGGGAADRGGSAGAGDNASEDTNNPVTIYRSI